MIHHLRKFPTPRPWNLIPPGLPALLHFLQHLPLRLRNLLRPLFIRIPVGHGLDLSELRVQRRVGGQEIADKDLGFGGFFSIWSHFVFMGLASWCLTVFLGPRHGASNDVVGLRKRVPIPPRATVSIVLAGGSCCLRLKQRLFEVLVCLFIPWCCPFCFVGGRRNNSLLVRRDMQVNQSTSSSVGGSPLAVSRDAAKPTFRAPAALGKALCRCHNSSRIAAWALRLNVRTVPSSSRSA